MQDNSTDPITEQAAGDQPDPLRRKRRLIKRIIFAGVGVALLAGVVVGRWPALVAWHKWRMESAFRQAMNVGPSHAQGGYIDSHDFHHRKLVELGYFDHRKFQFRYIKTNTPEERQLWKLIRQTFPPTDYVNVSSDYYEEPTPIVLEVWDRPSRMPLWAAFVKEHDVPDFDQRFGLESRPTGKLVEVWTLPGEWQGVACEQTTGAIYAVDMSGTCAVAERSGKIKRQMHLPEGGTEARFAKLPDRAGTALLVFSRWLGPLRAYDANGKQLWSYAAGGGIDGVWTYDLNGNGADEVIIGFNGATGLHVLNSDGKLLWKYTGTANVWHVCAGELLGAGKPGVVGTSARGVLNVFSADGVKLNTLSLPFYADMVRVGQPPAGGETAAVFAVGSSSGEEATSEPLRLARLTADGAMAWSMALPKGGPTTDSSAVAPGRPWLALGMRDGEVNVVDVDKEQVVASANNLGYTPQVCWAAPEGSAAPLLIVATGNALKAFRVAP